MPGLSHERIQQFKDLLEKKGGKEVSWEEASEGVYSLVRLVDLIFDSWVIDQKRKKKLEENPSGFHLEGNGYTCFICRGSFSNEETWYDKYGIKCIHCRDAVNKKIIPASIAKNEDSWYSKYDLQSLFNIDRHALGRFIKQGILKPRVIPGPNGKPHAYVFLIKDNKDTLPPKKLLESRSFKEEKDGKTWIHSEPWYRFVDPKEHLKGYKIMDYLQVINEEKN